MDAGRIRNKLAALLAPGGRDETLFAAQEAYKRYAVEAQSTGQPALSFDEWMRAQSRRPNALLAPADPMENTPGYSFFFKQR